MVAHAVQHMLQEGLAHHRAGRLPQAFMVFDRARRMAPNEFEAWHLAGLVAMQLGRWLDAAGSLTRALRLRPAAVPCALRLGQALVFAGQRAEAEAVLRHAVKLQPQNAEAWDLLAHCLKTQDKLAEALQCHERIVTLQPGYAPGWFGYGLTLSLFGRITEALACHERALAADPCFAKAHYGRAQALQQANRLPEAIAAYDRFLELEPGHAEANSYRLFALNYGEDRSREEIFAAHAAYGRSLPAGPARAFPATPDPARRLRVAVLSPDLRMHSCAYFLEPLLQHLDRGAFEVVLYHDHFREDAVSARLKAGAALWRNFVGVAAADVERTILADAPDILVDLAGHTGMVNRLPLFARRLAPVQVNYLGYPNTTGVPAMDYRFTDAIADPVGEADGLATERLIRFAPTAWCYAPPADSPAPAVPPSARGGPFTFGCFNNPGKVGPATARLWAEVLRAVPGSRLLLKGKEFSRPDVRDRQLALFAAAGIAADRIELVERTAGVSEHLALYGRMDVALDSFPYHGTTTTCEALWMGVPVVSLRGDRHLARVGASLLTAVGHPEWVAATSADYVAIAARLAADPAALVAGRAGLRGELERSALMDHAGQAARWGAALRQCWTAWCAAHAPAAA